MPCSIKVLGALSAVTACLAFAMAIIGIVIMTSSIPTSQCGSNANVNTSERDAINAVISWLGVPTMVCAILVALGAIFGILGGCGCCSNGQCAIIAQASLHGVGGGIMILVALWTLAFAAGFSTICDYECPGADVAANCGGVGSRWSIGNRYSYCEGADQCCRCSGGVVSMMCKESKDWGCSFATTKFVATCFGILMATLSIFASGCGCAAACCCQSTFTGLRGQAPPFGAPVGGPVVVGQPIEAYTVDQSNAKPTP